MKTFKKIMHSIWAVVVLGFAITLIVWTVQDVQWQLEWDGSIEPMSIALESFFSLLMLSYAVLEIYGAFFAHIITKDQRYIYKDLIEQFDALQSPKKQKVLYMKTFNELPFKARRKILTEILEELK